MRKNFQYICLLLVLTNIHLACGQKRATTTSDEKMSYKKTEKEWLDKLSPEQFYILRQKGTERPYTGKLLMNNQKGVYTCAGCGNVLFDSDSKFDAECGWPSFDREIEKGRIRQEIDRSLGMKRIEILCARCDGHLGHVFDDGPTETGLRYCVNSLSMEFIHADSLEVNSLRNKTK